MAGHSRRAWRLGAIFAVTMMTGMGATALSPAAANQAIPDQYPASLLYSYPVEVIPGVWSAIGQTGPGTYENAGHNNNLSFIVTGEGKAPALREVLVGDRDEQRYPSQLVAPTDGQLTFLVDRAAAAELPRTHEYITRIDHGADA